MDALHLFVPHQIGAPEIADPNGPPVWLDQRYRKIWMRSDRLADAPDIQTAWHEAVLGSASSSHSVAAVTALGLPELDPDWVRAGFWLRATPVYLHPDRDHLILFGPQSLNPTASESAELIQLINKEYQSDGAIFYESTSAEWLVRFDSTLQCTCTPVAAASGRSVLTQLPAGPDAATIHKLMNEIQMLFHSHSSNRLREENGQMPISGLWFDEPGTCPQRLAVDFDLLVTNHPLGRGLMQLSEAKAVNVPNDYLDIDAASRRVAVLLDQTRHENALREQSRKWLEPALDAVKSGQLRQLILHLGNGVQHRFTRHQKFRFWRHG